MNHDRNREKYLREDIINQLKEEFGETNVCVVSTEGYDLTTNPKGRNSKKDRSNWADYVVKKLYDGSIRKEYPSDVWFYKFDGITKMELENHMK